MVKKDAILEKVDLIVRPKIKNFNTDIKDLAIYGSVVGGVFLGCGMWVFSGHMAEIGSLLPLTNTNSEILRGLRYLHENPFETITGTTAFSLSISSYLGIVGRNATPE